MANTPFNDLSYRLIRVHREMAYFGFVLSTNSLQLSLKNFKLQPIRLFADCGLLHPGIFDFWMDTNQLTSCVNRRA